MLKFRDGAAYVFAMQKRQYTSGTYTFSLPLELPASGTVEVVGEGRTLAYSGSVFTDAFAAEYSHHIYRIVKQVPGGRGKTAGLEAAVQWPRSSSQTEHTCAR
ncbi:hypothetical protein [Corallococcus carmarthensis]|uniref:hypothetical protein n=1 Tax=Corallococcus carmarthensis TaxID=2316728 RepID=UPI00148BB98A|nr:hypothetical protein [Corallococcus carmarthensis]NOK20035.1 hypothetical protein [Corallococcus carmarthensis]